MRIPYLAFPALCLWSTVATGQKTLVDARDQAEGWYLPVECAVTANGGNTDNVEVTVFKDNTAVTEILPEKKKSGFVLELDIDNNYTIRVRKEGYREELIHIDTHLPENQVKYQAYKCFVDLQPEDKFSHSDPFYLDFPSAMVRWSDEKKGFTHSEEYHTNIQLKVALLGAQLETE